MKNMTGINNRRGSRKVWPDKLCALEGCGCMFEDRPIYPATGKTRKYCSASCSAVASRSKGLEILNGKTRP